MKKICFFILGVLGVFLGKAQLNGVVSYESYPIETRVSEDTLVLKLSDCHDYLGYSIFFSMENNDDYYLLRGVDTVESYLGVSQINLSYSILTGEEELHGKQTGLVCYLVTEPYYFGVSISYGNQDMSGRDTVTFCKNLGILDFLINYETEPSFFPSISAGIEHDTSLRFMVNGNAYRHREFLEKDLNYGDKFRVIRLQSPIDFYCEDVIQREDTLFLPELTLNVIEHCVGVVSGQVWLTGGRGSRDALSNVLIKSDRGDVVISDSIGRFSLYFEDKEPITKLYIGDINYQMDSLSLWFDNLMKISTNNILTTHLIQDNDLSISLNSFINRPGFTIPYYISITNFGKNELTTDVRVILDDYLEYSSISGEDQPYQINGNELTWNQISIKSGKTIRLKFYATVDREVALGQVLMSSSQLLQSVVDDNPENDVFNFATTVTGSFDPNDKSVNYIGSSSGDYIYDTTQLEYIIRFQNTGTDTAFNVHVVDVISDALDITSINSVSTSHNYRMLINGDTVKWFFDNILLPDSIVNEPASHGFISFQMRQKEGNTPGTSISNSAEIFFDFNNPIVTNEVISIVDNNIVTGFRQELSKSKGLLEIYPSPAQHVVKVSQQGQIEVFNSSGIKLLSKLNSQEIEVSQLPSGLYFIQVVTNEGIVLGNFIKE